MTPNREESAVGLFEDLKFKAEELLGTVDADDVQTKLADLQDQLKEKADSISPEQKDELLGKINELKEKYSGLLGGVGDSVAAAAESAVAAAGTAAGTAAGAADAAADAAKGAAAVASDAVSGVTDKLAGN